MAEFGMTERQGKEHFPTCTQAYLKKMLHGEHVIIVMDWVIYSITKTKLLIEGAIFILEREGMNLEDREYIDYLLRREIVRNLYKPIILTEQQIDEKLEDVTGT